MPVTTSRRCRIGATVTATLTVSTLVAAVPVPVVVRDRFTDNAINQQLWDAHTLGGIAMSETNQRLQFSAAGATGGLSHAGLEVERWGAKWRYDFEIELDYRLNLATVTGQRQAILGIGLAFSGQYPETFTGFAAGIVRDDVGLTLGIARYSNGNLVVADFVDITDVSGELNLEYDRSSDRLTARAAGQEVHLNGMWAQFGAQFGNQPLVIAIGCTTLDGNFTFPGSRVFVDEFKFEGVKKSR